MGRGGRGRDRMVVGLLLSVIYYPDNYIKNVFILHYDIWINIIY
jgi:hypothetical protein